MPSSLPPGPREHAESCGSEECSGCAQHPHTSLRSTGHEGLRACLHHPLDNQPMGGSQPGAWPQEQGRGLAGKGKQRKEQGKGERAQASAYEAGFTHPVK